MYDLIPFRFPDGDQEIRTMRIDGEPWFVGADVAGALGYANTRDALTRHVDDEDRDTVAFYDGTSGNPNATIINEAGLYSLILGSRLPAAKAFKRWVIAEVLPALRKTGSYSLAAEPRSDLDIIRGMVDALEADRERLAALEDRTEVIESQLAGAFGNYDEFTALGYAKHASLRTDRPWLSLLGKRASKLMRDAGDSPRVRQDASFGAVNVYPAEVLAEAVRQLEGS